MLICCFSTGVTAVAFSVVVLVDVAFSVAFVADFFVGSIVVAVVFVDKFFIGSSFFWIVLMVPRFQGGFGGWTGFFFFVVVVVVIIVTVVSWRLLRTGSGQMTYLFACPTKKAPALNDHHHLLIFIRNDMRDGLKALSVQAYVEDIVPVCRLTSHPPLSQALLPPRCDTH